MTDLVHPETGAVLFSHDELACKATGEVRLDPNFARDLVSFRVAFNRSMTVNSCCRSKNHNTAIGGHKRSLHVFDKPYHPVEGTCAIDIAATDPFYRYRLITLATSMYWSIGIARTFIHLDRRQLAGLKSGVAFVY